MWLRGSGSLFAGLCGGILAGLFGVGGASCSSPCWASRWACPSARPRAPPWPPCCSPTASRPVALHAPGGGGDPLGPGLDRHRRFPPRRLAGRGGGRPGSRRRRCGWASPACSCSGRGHPAAEEPAGGRRRSTVPVSWAAPGCPGWPSASPAGLASGLLGIGGAVIMVPLLVWLLRLPQKEAQATTLVLMLAPIGLPGVWVYAQPAAPGCPGWPWAGSRWVSWAAPTAEPGSPSRPAAAACARASAC